MKRFYTHVVDETIRYEDRSGQDFENADAAVEHLWSVASQRLAEAVLQRGSKVSFTLTMTDRNGVQVGKLRATAKLDIEVLATRTK